MAIRSLRTPLHSRHVVTSLAALVALGLVACSSDPGAIETSSFAASAATTEVGGVTLRTVMKGTYVGAANDGGSTVSATATVAREWETFTLVDRNGGSLVSGDLVSLRAGSGQYLQAASGGGADVNATGASPLDWETFRIARRAGGGAIARGDVIGLQAVTSGKWFSAENGGGGPVFAYGPAFGPWEELVLGIGSVVAPPPAPPPAPPSTPAPTPAPADGWKLAWADEFDGSAIDESKWSYEVQRPGWVNHELQSYTDHRRENARVEDGHLVIEGRRDNFNGSEYSSARLKTQGKASWAYGKVEARIQLPGGSGTWPAFWMMPDDQSRGWPACGEIDIMEEVGYDPDSIHATTHSQAYNWKSNNQRTAATTVSGVTGGYHTYALEWFPDHIDMFVDGRKYYTSPNDNTGDDAWPFHKNFHVILNLAIGGDWGAAKGVDPSIWPRQMLVDYVRVYQR
jgi:beta-glucanase (GH16 family)